MTEETDLEKNVARLREELREAERLVSEERKVRQNSVKPIYRFTLSPTEKSGFHEILDDSVVLVRLEGIVVNAAEMEAVGNPLFQGGMTYYFNKLSGKIITSEGGGNVWVSTEATFSPSAEQREDARKTFDALSAFFLANPEGGDVTEIVQTHREKFGKP